MPNPTATVEFQLGHENQIGASWKCQNYVLDSQGEEHHITQGKNVIPGWDEINKQGCTAVDDQPWDVGGGWTTINAQVPEGTVFKLFLTRKRLGGIPATCATLYRVRRDAPLVRLRVKGICLRHSTKTELTAFFGRADRISLEEAKAGGYRSKPAYDKFFDSPDEEEIIDVIQEAPGVVAAPVRVEATLTRSGEVVYTATKIELRRIRSRRPR